MKIPQSFKDKIKQTFYDKEILLISSSLVKEADGHAKLKESTTTGSFFGNVNFSNLKNVQENYGIQEEIDLTVTTDTAVAREQVIQYDNRLFKIIEAKKFDSHYLLIAKLWSSKSSDSLSV